MELRAVIASPPGGRAAGGQRAVRGGERRVTRDGTGRDGTGRGALRARQGGGKAKGGPGPRRTGPAFGRASAGRRARRSPTSCPTRAGTAGRCRSERAATTG